MNTMFARRIATTAAVTLGLLGAAAAVPTLAFAGESAPAAATATTATATTAASGNNALLAAINDARLHPEKYAPHGNTTGAKLTACATPFTASSSLYSGANAHDKYLASQSLAWVQTGLNAHRDPNGALAWEDNGHIVAAGYRSARAEIVAWGQTSATAAVIAWMQDDAGSQWGHRNIILNCSLTYSGASNYTGGPAGHYYTADMGNP